MTARFLSLALLSFGLCIVLAACGRSCSGQEEADNPHALVWHAAVPPPLEDAAADEGEQELPPPMRLTDVPDDASTFAVGESPAPAVITVVDGISYAMHMDGNHEVVSRSRDLEAAWLLHGVVAGWRSFPVPPGLATRAALESWLPEAAREAGIEAGEAVPFKLTCSAAWVAYHLPEHGLEPGALRFLAMEDTRVSLVGVLDPPAEARAVRGAHATLLHAVSGDSLRGGRVDDFEFRAPAIAWLPVR